MCFCGLYNEKMKDKTAQFYNFTLRPKPEQKYGEMYIYFEKK